MTHEITERSFQLAKRLVTVRDDPAFRDIVRREVLRQLIRSGCSVGSNLTEAGAAQSKADFIAKVSIARKEIWETQFWLRLATESGVLSPATTIELQRESASIGKVISTIVRNAKRHSGRGEEGQL